MNSNPSTTTEIEQEPANVASHDFTGIALAPIEETRVAPTVFPSQTLEKPRLFSPAEQSGVSGSGHNRDASRHGLLPSILPLLQAAIWEAWADTLELISFDSGRCEEATTLLDRVGQKPGARWLDRVCPLDLHEVKAFFALDASDLARRSIDYRIILAPGELLWVRHWLLHRLVGDNGRASLSGLIVAISEQKCMEQQCLRAGERERNRIGHELHDDVCQELAGLGCMMEVLAGRLATKAPDLQREFDELKADVTAAMKRTRSMAHGLVPAQLNYASLEDALRELVRQTETRFGLAARLDLPCRLPHHSPDQIIHLYRIVQEAVSNSIRHGRATEIRIKVEISATYAELRVEDNGSGFPAGTSRPDGLGLHSMKYRTQILGGSLDFGNHQPSGAAVQLKYPLAAGRLARPTTAAPDENEHLHC
ncbi:MAG TPA: sensor histidine kinase [Opitutaceae bacterium]|nr:sensor histidine kinase [Opitutaceae bacterium]